jgi:hypothetical protein
MPAYEYVIGIRAIYHFLFMENPLFEAEFMWR